MSSEREIISIIERKASEYSVYALFSNPLRLLILKIIKDRGRASWNDIYYEVEKITGNRVNPNAINFHLTKLIKANIITKTESKGYMLNREHVDKDKRLKEIIEEI